MKYRKKPVVIEALRWNGTEERLAEIQKWARGSLLSCAGRELAIQTLEGRMTASDGDWIIRGVKGEFYPCKPDIFSATYDPA
jgi:hypothetical protein